MCTLASRARELQKQTGGVRSFEAIRGLSHAWQHGPLRRLQERAPDDDIGIVWHRIAVPKWHASSSSSTVQVAKKLESMATAAARRPEPAKGIEAPKPFDDCVFLCGRAGRQKRKDGTMLRASKLCGARGLLR